MKPEFEDISIIFFYIIEKRADSFGSKVSGYGSK